jgi:hypothetical protein
MKWVRFSVAFAVCVAVLAAPAIAQNITAVVETGGDNEATDTITAKWTGQTWLTTLANEPIPSTPVDTSYTLPAFGPDAPAYVDRNHRYANDTANNLPIPAYLVGGEYIIAGNDNRDNGSYHLDVTVGNPSTVYLLIDNRVPDGNAADPPMLGPTAMQWVLDQGWQATSNGLNRAGDPAFPDEVAIDEGADGTINQYFSVYRKDVGTGTFSLLQADASGRNMYGAVVVAIPEPGTIVLLSAGLLGLTMMCRRTKR